MPEGSFRGKRVYRLLGTFFYTGLVPRLPGTAASALAALFCYFLSLLSARWWVYLSLFLFLTLVALLLEGWAKKEFGESDPKPFVIDEAAGFFLARLFLPAGVFWLLASFALFRFFDILKPFPIRNVENLRRGGVVLDDLVAGFFAGVILLVFSFVKLILTTPLTSVPPGGV